MTSCAEPVSFKSPSQKDLTVSTKGIVPCDVIPSEGCDEMGTMRYASDSGRFCPSFLPIV
eukprot:m.392598 g.392598  ORF g.392598 m.392598 type:complete len:60 (+) comp28325_c0_seq14:299-478(+)